MTLVYVVSVNEINSRHGERERAAAAGAKTRLYLDFPLLLLLLLETGLRTGFSVVGASVCFDLERHSSLTTANITSLLACPPCVGEHPRGIWLA